MSNQVFIFVEPHHTGGDCTVRITEEQILKYMHKLQKEDDKFKDVSDSDLIDYFIINHWCTKEEI